MIAIYTQLLSRKCGAQLDSEAHKFVRYTVDGAQRMEMLLRDLLAYTQAVNIRGVPDRPTESNASAPKRACESPVRHRRHECGHPS